MNQPHFEDSLTFIANAEHNAKATAIVDAAWYSASLSNSSVRWNKIYPYQLLILDEQKGEFTRVPGMQFTLPIPPQELSISSPFAIDLNVTLGGVHEQHNGAPLRFITAQGTTGVMPLRGTGKSIQGAAAGGIAAGTINQVGQVLDRTRTLLSRETQLNIVKDTEIQSGMAGALSGYMQFRILQQFLESYITAKKNGSRSWRLAFACWKDEAVYLVTPTAFDVKRSSSSGLEYMYTLAFKAWARIRLSEDGIGADTRFTPSRRDTALYNQILGKFNEARAVLQSVSGAIAATVSDLDALVFEPMRQTMLFIKDVVGVGITCADLPNQIKKEFRDFALQSSAFSSALDSVFQARDANDSGGTDTSAYSTAKSIQDLALVTGQDKTRAGATTAAPAHEANTVFEHPEDYPELWDRLRPSDLNLSPTLKDKIQAEVKRVSKMSRFDFEKMRDSFIEVTANLEAGMGVNDSTCDTLYGRELRQLTRTLTDEDWQVLFAMNDIVQQLDRLCLSEGNRNDTPTTVDVVAGMAQAAGIAFTVPRSKFAVPFPYGCTLEQVAFRYLGDPNRWLEIATLNGLRQPYVDEEGFELPLLVNGHGNQVVVGDVTNLFVGQSLWVSSLSTSRTQRRITGITRVGSTYTLTLSGDQDLDRFSTVAQATVHAFLPGTVNSQQLIYIPSDKEPADGDYWVKDIPGVDSFDPIIRVGGIDLLLDHNGDLALTGDGDTVFAVGLTNIIQWLRIVLNTKKGALIDFPDLGASVPIGSSTADVDVKELASSLTNLVQNDPTFTGIDGISILKAGPVLRLSFNVGIAGVEQVIPLSFDIRR